LPRHPDPQLETRVLLAARKLWNKGGERSLTMRAVASAAGTNTPAVYRRFKNRRDLLRALMLRTQADVSTLIVRCNSLQEICHTVFDFAVSHPREYELLSSRLVVTSRLPRTNLEYVVTKTAGWLKLPADQCRPLVVALLSLIHGSAMLLITGAIPEHAELVRSSFSVAVDQLVRNYLAFGK